MAAPCVAALVYYPIPLDTLADLTGFKAFYNVMFFLSLAGFTAWAFLLLGYLRVKRGWHGKIAGVAILPALAMVAGIWLHFARWGFDGALDRPFPWLQIPHVEQSCWARPSSSSSS